MSAILTPTGPVPAHPVAGGLALARPPARCAPIPVADELSCTLAPIPEGPPGPADVSAALTEIEEPWLSDALADETGASTAEYAITVLAACGFAAVLVVLLKSGEVRELLMSIITTALSLGR
ncbi:DUF4244 domain-containing protein [Brachybacterium hainanense]|uniref:DUF4244 domain-containing protein n=1 Tax=Brachybacterium hainanense TaxID=1541174 RepID=A0ABV6RF48_9MICO